MGLYRGVEVGPLLLTEEDVTKHCYPVLHARQQATRTAPAAVAVPAIIDEVSEPQPATESVVASEIPIAPRRASKAKSAKKSKIGDTPSSIPPPADPDSNGL